MKTVLSADGLCRLDVDDARATVRCGERVCAPLTVSGAGAMLAVSNCGFFVADVTNQLRQWLYIYECSGGTWTKVHCSAPMKAVNAVRFDHTGVLPDVVCELVDGTTYRLFYDKGAWKLAR